MTSTRLLGLAASIFLALVSNAMAALSTAFTVSGGVTTPATYDQAALAALPSTTRTVTYLAGKRSVTSTFTGVLLTDILDRATVKTNPGIKSEILSRYVTATGSDGYKAVFSLGELLTDFGNAGVLVAYRQDGHDLGDAGFARLVVPGDTKGGRYVSNLVDINVASAIVTPLPGGFLVLASGLPGLLFLRRHAGG
ncbi:Oxidoreductase molybdopterin binding domain-containing protein [Arboricoccus pini]|uniref:Oxidoreductase molybdopterin binding domain-containing protein n=1 Tax=Arboricoccus pini TaxID=1963835 RepID=A0A212RN29_9PROT|nr:molybdopterin-dependent oxidoreductase [Arboricoccus pini]SNB73822.1 Oxidoreductase molybdopterin binding domain-containing protein [Arboricoccus pini]